MHLYIRQSVTLHRNNLHDGATYPMMERSAKQAQFIEALYQNLNFR